MAKPQFTTGNFSIGAGEVDASKELVPGNASRGRLLISLHTAADVFLKSSDDAVADEGILLTGKGASVEIRPPLAHLPVNGICDEAVTGGYMEFRK